jgi:hypothetical protein
MLFTAIDKGYIFDKLRQEGDKFDISNEWLADYKKEHGKDFECSWLEPAEERPKPAKVKSSKTVKPVGLDDSAEFGPEIQK